jgi:acyl-CoA reductase-like NAD-dependent aldehyde dehydrogenase
MGDDLSLEEFPSSTAMTIGDELGEKSARRIHIADIGNLAASGHFVAPSIFAVDSPTHRLAQEEIFGPVLTVLKARDFDEALDIANSTAFALTGGVHSRTPSNLRRAREEYHAGNLYLNRSITGAIVGRQPFGGTRASLPSLPLATANNGPATRHNRKLPLPGDRSQPPVAGPAAAD